MYTMSDTRIVNKAEQLAEILKSQLSRDERQILFGIMSGFLERIESPKICYIPTVIVVGNTSGRPVSAVCTFADGNSRALHSSSADATIDAYMNFYSQVCGKRFKFKYEHSKIKVSSNNGRSYDILINLHTWEQVYIAMYLATGIRCNDMIVREENVNLAKSLALLTSMPLTAKKHDNFLQIARQALRLMMR